MGTAGKLDLIAELNVFYNLVLRYSGYISDPMGVTKKNTEEMIKLKINKQNQIENGQKPKKC